MRVVQRTVTSRTTRLDAGKPQLTARPWVDDGSQALLLIEVNVAVKRKALADVSMLGMVTATLGRPLGWALGFMYFCFR
jgi:hypothetical protein